MDFSRWVFRLAGIYGLIVLVPQYFLEQKLGDSFSLVHVSTTSVSAKAVGDFEKANPSVQLYQHQ
jgi:hypothetical protein